LTLTYWTESCEVTSCAHLKRPYLSITWQVPPLLQGLPKQVSISYSQLTPWYWWGQAHL